MNTEFLGALKELEKEKGLAFEVLVEAIEAALISAYKKNFGSSQNARVRIDRDTGEVHVYQQKMVVDEATDSTGEMGLAEARELDPNYEIGDCVEVEVTPREFGRIATQTAKQVVTQRLREAERNLIFQQFVEREQDIVTGTIRRLEMRNVLVDLGRTEAVLPAAEQVPGELYRPGDRLKAYVIEVRKTSKGPQIILSRTHPGLLRRLFELEVPEIHDGTVEIKACAREPGLRTKIAVASHLDNVDPVGACVGPRGTRVQNVVNELQGEKIDIIRWEDDPEQFVANALSPAKVVSVTLNEETRLAQVTVPDYQLSLAIGREGQNARLAARLTGWKIDIKSFPATGVAAGEE
ncbi:MAG: transcription termination/antitermination protein NusA [Clostridia bacterium]|nr:MAG: transcription termination/antitermination protein NusA [Clostridia bacterium]